MQSVPGGSNAPEMNRHHCKTLKGGIQHGPLDLEDNALHIDPGRINGPSALVVAAPQT
jgi:hypothetical protein